ncbi:hypothetical protein ACI2JN_14800 [Ochrobactrum teleogrylli]|uniref:hypothetical protein n=1 Tax=Ochrobactrum teleogrylli TaxID=2479765 RepID=UPI003850148E
MMTAIFKTACINGFIAMAFLASAGSAFAKSPCDGVTTSLTKQQRSNYSALIAKSLRKKVKPTAVKIDSFMQSGEWAVVYADVPVADPGYFFFDLSGKTPQLKDVWGGMADRSEVPDLVKWAKKLGANAKIASCFADTATES